MAWKRVFRLSNLKARLGVGLLLAVLFCIQCSQSGAGRSTEFVTAVGGQTVGAVSVRQANELERLAREDHVALLKQAIAHYDANYRTYTCTFIKQERLGGKLSPEQWIEVKFRQRPFSVAMKWVKNAPIGEAVLYVEGQRNGMMLVQPKGLLLAALAGGAVEREPAGREAMANTLRPVTMFGFRNMLENLLTVYQQAQQRGESANRFVGYGQVGGRKVMILERILPPRNDYPAKVTTWYLDVEHLVPLGMEASDFDGQVSCRYFFQDVKLNAALGDEDFTPQANGMKAPR